MRHLYFSRQSSTKGPLRGNDAVAKRSERPRNRNRNHPLHGEMDTSRVDGVKAPLHNGTPSRTGPRFVGMRFSRFCPIRVPNFLDRGAAVDAEDVVGGARERHVLGLVALGICREDEEPRHAAHVGRLLVGSPGHQLSLRWRASRDVLLPVDLRITLGGRQAAPAPASSAVLSWAC